ncbi:MAG TPA: DUF1858 domain-containing protein [bacterium]|nr:DUF1858 domain-containing protein [bacterium]
MQNRAKSSIGWLVIAAVFFLLIRLVVRPGVTVIFGKTLSPLPYQLIWAVLATLGIWLCTVLYRNVSRIKELSSSLDSFRDSLMRQEQETQAALHKLKEALAHLSFDQLKREGKFRFTKDTPLTEALAVHPDVAKLLFEHGLACVSCPSAATETIGQAVEVHGMDVEPILEELNKLLKN